MTEFNRGLIFGGFIVSVFWLCGLLYLLSTRKERERKAFNEGAQVAIDNAAMKAYDMGRPDIRKEINAMWERAS